MRWARRGVRPSLWGLTLQRLSKHPVRANITLHTSPPLPSTHQTNEPQPKPKSNRIPIHPRLSPSPLSLSLSPRLARNPPSPDRQIHVDLSTSTSQSVFEPRFFFETFNPLFSS